MQGPTIQGLMSSYLEQSATTFLDMQQQLQKQARSIFGNFPFGSNLAGAAGEGKADAPSSEPEGFKQPQKKDRFLNTRPRIRTARNDWFRAVFHPVTA